jgi:hypothetical protein
MMKIKKWNPGKRGEFNPWGSSHRDQCLTAVVAVVAVVGEGTVEAAEEDVDSEFIRKCKWYLISQILLDQNTVPWVEGWHGCIAA